MDEEDKVKVAGGFLVQVLPGAKEEEIARFENTHPKKCQLSQPFWKVKTISKPSSKQSTVTRAYKRLSEEEIRFQCDCSHERFMNALASLPSSDLQEMKRETTGLKSLVNSAKLLTTLMKTTWRNSFVTNLNTPFMIGNVEIPNRTVLAPWLVSPTQPFVLLQKSSELDLLSWKWSLTRESNTTTKNPAHASY